MQAEAPQKRPQAEYAARVLRVLPQIGLLDRAAWGVGGTGQPPGRVYSKVYTIDLRVGEVQKSGAKPALVPRCRDLGFGTLGRRSIQPVRPVRPDFGLLLFILPPQRPEALQRRP